MEHITTRLPEKISGFISRQYPDHSLICTKEGEDNMGNIYYSVDLVKNDVYYHLKISAYGILINEDGEPVFVNGYYEHYY